MCSHKSQYHAEYAHRHQPMQVLSILPSKWCYIPDQRIGSDCLHFFQKVLFLSWMFIDSWMEVYWNRVFQLPLYGDWALQTERRMHFMQTYDERQQNKYTRHFVGNYAVDSFMFKTHSTRLSNALHAQYFWTCSERQTETISSIWYTVNVQFQFWFKGFLFNKLSYKSELFLILFVQE